VLLRRMFDWELTRALRQGVHSSRLGMLSWHVAVTDGVLELHAGSHLGLAALLQVLPQVSDVFELHIHWSFTAQHLAALASAPLLPPSITTLRLPDSFTDDVWPALLPALTAAPGLMDISEVVVTANATEAQIMSSLCCATGVTRPIRCRILETGVWGRNLSDADVLRVRDAAAADARRSHMVTVLTTFE
jgi:hypothetical protein